MVRVGPGPGGRDLSQAVAQDPQLVEVHIRDLPVALHARAEERHGELIREFTLITSARPAEITPIPRGFLAISERMQTIYAPYVGPMRLVIEGARRNGAESVDLVYTASANVAEAAAELLEQLEEADEFCRRGQLLTLAADEELVRFRRWYLGEFIRQAQGRPPIAWRDYTQ